MTTKVFVPTAPVGVQTSVKPDFTLNDVVSSAIEVALKSEPMSHDDTILFKIHNRILNKFSKFDGILYYDKDDAQWRIGVYPRSNPKLVIQIK